MKRQLLVTEDSSHTLYVPELDEHYHSTRGALMESKHVFIEAGLIYILEQGDPRLLSILEVGFGTGLNALLSWQECDKRGVSCYYESIEKYPLTKEEVKLLNYVPEAQFRQLHDIPWNVETVLSACFTFRKLQQDLLQYNPSRLFDLIFFDAFAPDIQPELWSDCIFQKLYDSQPYGGVLVTYSAKGSVKMALRRAGYHVQRLPGAGSKRHMVRACKLA